jgi:hypothetical protein
MKSGDRVRFIGFNDDFSLRQDWEIGDTAVVEKAGLFSGGGEWLQVTRDKDGYKNGYPDRSFEKIDLEKPVPINESHKNRYQIIMEEE